MDGWHGASPRPPEANGGGWAGLQRGRTGTHHERTRPLIFIITEKKMLMLYLLPLTNEYLL